MRTILLAIYLILIAFFGVLKVPVTLIWGPKQEVDSAKFVALWNLQEKHKTIDDYLPIYELNIVRLLYEFFVISLIMYLIYLIFVIQKDKKS
ncbi:hypothetical protein EJP82_26695 [Paenibacillus anaericanus]|uniref:Uncharacterized protein n=1 Tax=Paenibacillus anaericanus TaxID=170367 RepID=A0A433XVN0_9BACL|nr:hypothetical protein EJP82_26695 [Paenibacillus anaericanus]